ncbi:TPA: N-acetylmuramoyl-L-alanine amidase [Neisseria meningitidis]|uniref:N-acetylmuramoyl-L-alanine amidase n=18 Tax=Neisseria meningitidis TaxID=487 RepID=UPI00025E20B3|nr:N-acetylmuramoyl-L-alanine amidase [Neisseria meningitidis]EHP15316.1 amidase [Neisseria meningitidis NM220]MCL5694112.1 N-acetylmuramoyl-L-alanine amidase [Neisseria meningitidis]QEN76680.1 N-acetylmuramoyl-L-alanine amidase [Neisseria meningitidis]QEN76769.1 N-acetylmuramoyl-L-alanine amidase [Neisseria meningitidis]
MGKTVTLTAGHSNTDPGAVNGSDREADLAQDMRNIVAAILRDDYGLTVKTDGTGKGNMPLREAVKLIRGSDVAIEFHTNSAAGGTGKGNMPLREAVKLIRGSDVAIEFHTNSAAGKAATGIEALSTVKNKRWCQVLSKAVAKKTGWKLRGEDGFKPDNAGHHSRLAYAQAGGIVEPFFISNDTDLALFKTTKWGICRAIADAIAMKLGAARV